MHEQEARSPVRRPRMTPDRASELLDVTLDVLREVGYGALSMDLIASRGHCSKATIYRQWGSKAQMVAAAVAALRPADSVGGDTGSLRGDLLLLFEQLGSRADKDTTIIAALHHALLTDAKLAAAFRASMLEPARKELAGVVDRAMQRQELPGRPGAVQFLPHLVWSALVARPFFEGLTADAGYLEEFVDDVILPALLHS
ncbi:TetR/AcrR family transcriptional regulator [Streptomyces sp. NPDC058086]|uniref:TetR/AcrR family transcriptional regulator n=1 Tax=Streptomyces sp. NPDC058086 TaxID=3346334 RepID=UPI0036E1E31A